MLNKFIQANIKTIIIKQPHTFFSSTTGVEGFAVAGSSGGNPSLLLLSACEDIIKLHHPTITNKLKSTIK